MLTTNSLQQFKHIPTPFYYYDLELLEKGLTELIVAGNKYNYKIHYALKANVNDEILKRIHEYNLGADCVSGNELKKAISVGFSSEDIVFAGVGKTDAEISFALKQNIACFNCESLQEIQVINELAKEQSKVAIIAIRINPNLDAKTHQYITTGLQENKFGIGLGDIENLILILHKLKNVKLNGLHFHIGSQITDLEVYKKLCIKVNEIQDWFSKQGINFKHINLGGGLGINYNEPDKEPIPNFNAFFAIINNNLIKRNNQQIHFELGRSIVGQCGSLISKVLYVKNAGQKRFVIIDAGFTELIRPALYQSVHKIQNLNSKQNSKIYDIVGPICETTDSFGSNIELPETKRGDLIEIRSAGAYGQVMSSSYNLRSPAKAYYSTEFIEHPVNEWFAKVKEDISLEINLHL